MGKKIPLLLSTLTIISPILRCLSASATTLPPENERESWSVIELLSVADEVNERIKGGCDGDSSCMLSNYETIRSGDDKQATYLKLRERRFIVSSINPSDESFRVIYFDDSLKNKINGIDESEQINHAIFLWFNKWQMQVNIYFREELFNDDLEGKHILYYADERQSHNQIIFSNLITEFRLNEGEISGILNGRLDYSVGAGPHFDRSETANFSSCQYELGDECRAMFDNTGMVTYAPASPAEPLPLTPVIEQFHITASQDNMEGSDSSQIEVITEGESFYIGPNNDDEMENWIEVVDNHTEEDSSSTEIVAQATVSEKTSQSSSTVVSNQSSDNNTNGEMITSSLLISSEASTKQTTAEPNPVVASTLSAASSSVDGVEVPIAGGTEKCAKSPKSPWWLIALFGICLLPFVWFILPNRKNKKDDKKSKNL